MSVSSCTVSWTSRNKRPLFVPQTSCHYYDSIIIRLCCCSKAARFIEFWIPPAVAVARAGSKDFPGFIRPPGRTFSPPRYSPSSSCLHSLLPPCPHSLHTILPSSNAFCRSNTSTPTSPLPFPKAFPPCLPSSTRGVFCWSLRNRCRGIKVNESHSNGAEWSVWDGLRPCTILQHGPHPIPRSCCGWRVGTRTHWTSLSQVQTVSWVACEVLQTRLKSPVSTG